eukprot:TRINITY_DN40966_c0_g1_i1.p1 TRINITY_DN40966_c0_g1~~TRINITY_DN40966_c0_g1_i1.p1  ORF type:complete len:570 (+),score=170.13 TRINITY_DN40966_c0_g1_i1:38-1711(+)
MQQYAYNVDGTNKLTSLQLGITKEAQVQTISSSTLGKAVPVNVLVMVEGAFDSVTDAKVESYMDYHQDDARQPLQPTQGAKELRSEGVLQFVFNAYMDAVSCYGQKVDQEPLEDPEITRARRRLAAEIDLLRWQRKSAADLLDEVEAQISVVERQLEDKRSQLRALPARPERKAAPVAGRACCTPQYVREEAEDWDVFIVDSEKVGDSAFEDQEKVVIRATLRAQLEEANDSWRDRLVKCNSELTSANMEKDALKRELDLLRQLGATSDEHSQYLKAEKEALQRDVERLHQDLASSSSKLTFLEESSGSKMRALQEESDARVLELERLRRAQQEQKKKLQASCGALVARDESRQGHLLQEMAFHGWHQLRQTAQKHELMKKSLQSMSQASDSALLHLCTTAWHDFRQQVQQDRLRRQEVIQQRLRLHFAAAEMMIQFIVTEWRKLITEPRAEQALARMQEELQELRRHMVKPRGGWAASDRAANSERIMRRYAADFAIQDRGVLIFYMFCWQQEAQRTANGRLQYLLEHAEDEKARGCCVPNVKRRRSKAAKSSTLF